MIKKLWLVAAVASCILATSGLEVLGAGDYKVIVNPSNPATRVDRLKLGKIFLKKVTRWEHGIQILPVNQTVSAGVRKTFSEDIHGRSAIAVNNYWQKQIFSGRDVPPKEKRTDSAVILFVEENPGAVGYVAASAVSNKVKVLTIVD